MKELGGSGGGGGNCQLGSHSCSAKPLEALRLAKTLFDDEVPFDSWTGAGFQS